MRRIILVLAIICLCPMQLAYAETRETVKIPFTVETKYGKYSDALYFTPDEFKDLTQADIERIKKERVDNWIKAIETPPPPQEEEQPSQ